MLQTERLIVRQPVIEDAAAIGAFYRGDEAHMHEFTPATAAMLETEFWKSLIPQIRDEFDLGQSCRTFLYELDDRTVFGSANLSNIIRGPFQACYLGYNIDEAHEGRGLMREALQALIGFGFAELQLHRIMANYQPRNARSGGLLKRLGFVIEGTAKEYLRINGVWEEHVLTALTNQAWEAD
ncbi:MAG: GNAT family N-acetyltransferase [Candidatus Eremiobacteraeota bacterium]|nr:GNAT family N-acetyltransferase [Candidatus Eremiobacteraeota bacterium]